MTGPRSPGLPLPEGQVDWRGKCLNSTARRRTRTAGGAEVRSGRDPGAPPTGPSALSVVAASMELGCSCLASSVSRMHV